MIHKTAAGDYVISSHRMWLPGAYATEATARYALQFPLVQLQALADEVCHADRGNRPITTGDLKRMRAAMAAS